jgi:hypothetical protein
VLFCVQVVQIYNNESGWREKRKENPNLKNLVDKIRKLIIKELKLNVNHHIKIDKNLFKSNNA